MVNLRRGTRLQRKCKSAIKDECPPEPNKKLPKTKRKPNQKKTDFVPSDIVEKPIPLKESSIDHIPNKSKPMKNAKKRCLEESSKSNCCTINLKLENSQANYSQSERMGGTLKIKNSKMIKSAPEKLHFSQNRGTILDFELELPEKSLDSSFEIERRKSPLKPKLKDNLKKKNDLFVPQVSAKRKQRVSLEVASQVENEVKSHSVCTVILKSQRKRKNKNFKEVTGSLVTDDAPSFNGISPIIPSRKETEKLEILEKSMNLFQCPVSPIISNNASQRSYDYSYLALKSDVKSLPKPPKTRSMEISQEKSSKRPRKHERVSEDYKDENVSLLRTPLRQVFKSNVGSKTDTGFPGDSVELSDNEQGEEEGYTLFPLSKDHIVAASTSRSKPSNTSTSESQSMEYEDWLAAHQSDFDQFKDMDLCVE